ncbi:DUF1918 domain-containing protein [Cellulomonas terrae]|uniref:DUF1918 domain-containing protein n=1 Tax=Cellulomonas terrae TaxID=311234 RepID=A0A511JH18_9CELL|nr:DUF1918 domain-containing protein [Cellulomonas terrae]GEL97288.1 hypothetical protein CTE05_08350 [Cellulomonas terrae]
MKAAAGDRLVVAGAHLGDASRDAEVLEVRGADGGPPFLVRWSDSGHLGLVFPGPDAVIADPQAKGVLRTTRGAGGT